MEPQLIRRALREWLESNRITHGAFAQRLGCSRASVSLYAEGKRKPRPPLAQRIVIETKGAVTLEDLMGL